MLGPLWPVSVPLLLRTFAGYWHKPKKHLKKVEATFRAREWPTSNSLVFLCSETSFWIPNGVTNLHLLHQSLDWALNFCLSLK